VINRTKSCKGVTLIELVVVLVIISIGLAGVAQTYAFIWKSSVTVAESDLQTASNLAQSCALAILGEKRSSGSAFANFSTFTCSQSTSICAPGITQTNCTANLSDPSGYSLQTQSAYVSKTATTRNGCPTNLECLKISVTARGTSANSASELFLLVANYE
jgi:prepilin-type N-terminal cleavage/methylation domain-containing protein